MERDHWSNTRKRILRGIKGYRMEIWLSPRAMQKWIDRSTCITFEMSTAVNVSTVNFSNRTSQDQESIRSPMKGILEYRELDESEIPNNERITRQNRDHGLFKINVQGWSIGYRRNFPYISIRLWIAKRVPCCWHSWFSGQFRLVREEGNVQTRGRIHWIVNIFATPLCTIIPQLRPISITTGDHVQVLGYYVTTHRRVAY